MERRALYNSLRMNWLVDPSTPIEPWQAEDYRASSMDELFKKLHDFNIQIDKASFIALAEDCSTPEELADLVEKSDDREEADKIYLILFELWRRLIPEKQSLSIFCDELDHQIYLYDTGKSGTVEGVEDALANLKMILDENYENSEGEAEPQELLTLVINGCANDIESFLYDFIVTQIEHQNEPYALELLDNFMPYVHDIKRFQFLKAEALFSTDREASIQIVEKLVKDKDKDLEFSLELLNFLAKVGDEKLFKPLAKQTVPLLRVEEDFLDFSNICSDFFHYSDHDEKEIQIQAILKENEGKLLDGPISSSDPRIKGLLKILNS